MYDNMFQQMGFSTTTHSELLTAATTGDFEKAKQAIENGVDVNYVPRDKSVLFVAVENKHYDIVDLLLENNANPNIKNRIGWTPIHEAVLQENENLVRKLLSFNASLFRNDLDGVSPLFLMIKNNQMEMFSNFLTENPQYIEATDLEGNNLLAQAILIQNKDAVKILMQQEPDLEITNNQAISIKELAQSWPEILPLLKTEKIIFEEEKNKQKEEAQEIKKQLEQESLLGVTKISKKKRTM